MKVRHPIDLASVYIPELLEEEIALQRAELRDFKICVIQDATPRQGDVFARVGRMIVNDPDTRTAKAVHKLFYVSTLSGSLNHNLLSSEISKGLASRQILGENVPVVAIDACVTNIRVEP